MPDLNAAPLSAAAAPAAVAPPAASDPILSLKKMSTTAGVAGVTSGEYVAVNPLAVISILLGLASVLVFLGDVLLIVPAAGIACALLARRQVRRSNGTQTGGGLAIVGLSLCLLLGGGAVAAKVVGGWTEGPDRRQIAGLIEEFGRDVNEHRYHYAYLLCSPRFQTRVPESRFTETLQALNSAPDGGGVQSMKSNGQFMFSDETGTGARIGWAMALIQFQKVAGPAHQSLTFVKSGGRWTVDDIPLMFPAERRAPRRRAAAP